MTTTSDTRDASDVLALLRSVTAEIEADLLTEPGLEDAALRGYLADPAEPVLSR